MKLFHFLICVGLVRPALVWAAPWAPAGISHVLDQSDTVVVAKVRRSLVVGNATFHLTVEHTLKGSLPVGSSVSINADLPSMNTMSLPETTLHGILFLARTATGWKLIPGAVGAFDFDDFVFVTPESRPPYVIGSAATVLERVLAEIAWEEENRQSSGLARHHLLTTNWTAHARGQNSPLLMQIFRRWRDGAVPRLKLLGIRGLLTLGDNSSLTSIPGLASWSTLREWRALLDEIKYYYANDTPASSAALGALTVQANSRDIRLAAASALARIHTRESLPYLADLLDSSDLELRACGVGGLSMFANAVPPGGKTPRPEAAQFRTNDTIQHSTFDSNVMNSRPGHYEAFWKRWWHEHRAALAK